MLPDLTLPVSLMALLARFRPVFTAPSFRTFCALAAGFLAQTGRRTVCGMLTGAGLAGAWPHQRAHRFSSAARWSSERLGLVLAKLIVAALVPEGGPVLVAIDDTLFRRTGKKVHAIGWFHDGSVKGPHQVGLGNNWVIAAIVVWLPFMTRPVALPVLARLVHKDITPAPASRLVLARQMTAALAAALPGRDIHVAADAAYAGKELARLPASVTWTTRLRKDAALYELPGPRTGKRDSPASKAPACQTWPPSLPPPASPRSPCTATARPPPSRPPSSPACGMGSSAPARPRWCWSATAPTPASTSPWPPPT